MASEHKHKLMQSFVTFLKKKSLFYGGDPNIQL